MADDNILVHTRGENFSFAIQWNLNLTGKTVEVWDSDSADMLTGWTLTSTTTLGLTTTTCARAWDATVPDGVNPDGTGYAFWLRFRTTDKSVALTQLDVWFK